MTRALSRKMVPRALEVIYGPSRPTGARGEHFRQHRHAHRHAVAHLVADDGLRSVGHVGGDLDAAVHGLRMHHDGVRARQAQALARQPPGREVPFALRQVPLAHALLLDAQHHDHVRPLESGCELRVARTACEFVPLRHEDRRGDDPQGAHAARGQRAPREGGSSPPRPPASPSKRCLRWYTVRASSSPCVGCDTCASPADSTLTWGATFAATSPGTPASASRITNASPCRDCRVYTVSSMLSPLTREDSCTSRLTTCAPKRLAASSKLTRVRVEGSVNRFATVAPVSARLMAGFAPRGRTKPWERSSSPSIRARDRPSSVSR